MGIDVQYDQTDLLNALRLHWRSHPTARRYSWVLTASFIILGTSIIHGLRQGNALVEGVLVAVSVITLQLLVQRGLLPVLGRLQAQRVYSRFQAPFHIEIGESGITLFNEHLSTEQAWADLHMWKEDAHSLLLYSSETSYFCIPKRLLDRPELMHDHLVKHGVPEHQAKQELISYAGLLLVAVYVAIRVFVA